MTEHVTGDLNVAGGSDMTAGETVAAAMQPVIDDYAEDLIPRIHYASFVEGLAVLTKVLKANPSLVETIWDVTPSLSTHLNMRVLTDRDPAVLELWALLLTDLSTAAYRYDESVDGEISGLLEGIRVRIVGLIPSDAVPEGDGQHEWTLAEVAA